MFERMRTQVPGFIAASLVDLRSGTTLAAHSARSDFDLAVAGVFNSEIVKQETKALQALKLESKLEGILLTLSDQIHILKLVDDGSAFVYLAADRSLTNLATARNALDHYASEVLSGDSHRLIARP